jgi:hypothetical protein
MEHEDGRHDARDDFSEEEPDAELSDYEDDDDEIRASQEREAGLTSFGGPAFGELFGHHQDDGDFNARNNP